MYAPNPFREDRTPVLHEFIRANSFATIVTGGKSSLVASHAPVLLGEDPPPLGTLRGHLARANPHWRDFERHGEALAIFHGPHAYVSPNWYRSKQQDGRVVPTWNYVAVHAYGTVRTFDSPAELQMLLTSLTDASESGENHPWRVDDAPRDYIRKLLGAIVGFEIRVTRLEGQWKLSQNLSAADREGIVEGLRQRGRPLDRPLADLMPDD